MSSYLDLDTPHTAAGPALEPDEPRACWLILKGDGLLGALILAGLNEHGEFYLHWRWVGRAPRDDLWYFDTEEFAISTARALTSTPPFAAYRVVELRRESAPLGEFFKRVDEASDGQARFHHLTAGVGNA